MGKIISWAATVFMVLAALAYSPSIASILMLITGFFLLPITRLKELRNKLIPKKWVRGVLIAVLFITAVLITPTNHTNDASPVDNNIPSVISDTVDTAEEIKTIPAVESESTDTLSAVTDKTLETLPPETEAQSKEIQTPETEKQQTETQSPETEKPAAEETQEQTVQPTETEAPVKEPPKPAETQPPKTETPEAKPAETTPPVVPAVPVKSTFNIHFIDVGQADAALVECDGSYMLIDGGNKADSNIIYSVLKKANVQKLNLVVATHAHEDHIGGIPGAYNYTTADKTLCPVTSYDSDAFADFKKFADSKGGGITVPAVGDTYSLGSAAVKILGVNSTADTNNSSIVLMITYGETKFLFTGDAEREAEQVILNSGADLSATVLKVGHHGSETSTTYPFLREIMPKVAIISVGEDNTYGHPTDNTLSRLRDAGVKVYRTDMQGDIYCTSDGKNVTISVTRNANADTLTNPVKIVEKPAAEQKPEEQKPTEEKPAEPSPEQKPAGTEYVLNTNTKKFHYPSCGSVKKMSEKNKSFYTGTREEVIAMGYDPCGNCNP